MLGLFGPKEPNENVSLNGSNSPGPKQIRSMFFNTPKFSRTPMDESRDDDKRVLALFTLSFSSPERFRISDANPKTPLPTSPLRRCLRKLAFDPSRRSLTFAPQDEGLEFSHFLHPEERRSLVSKGQGNAYAKVSQRGERKGD